jgi:hypothetical protein
MKWRSRHAAPRPRPPSHCKSHKDTSPCVLCVNPTAGGSFLGQARYQVRPPTPARASPFRTALNFDPLKIVRCHERRPAGPLPGPLPE